MKPIIKVFGLFFAVLLVVWMAAVVLGGVYEGAESYGKNKIPFFADLPGIGFLFTNSTQNFNYYFI